jgi:hypothetical protein
MKIVKNIIFYIWLPLLFSGFGQAYAAFPPDPLISADLKALFADPPSVKGYPYQELFKEAAQRYKLPLPYLLAVARGESFFDPNAVSSKGAIGLMQVMPATAGDYGVKKEKLFDPAKNIDTGAHLLSDLNRRLNDPYLALAAYYCGSGGVDMDDFTIREDCNEYVHYIHSHLKKILKSAWQNLPDSAVREKHFVLTVFDNFLDAESFVKFLSEKLPLIQFEIFRKEAALKDHSRYQYQIMAAGNGKKTKDEVCAMVEKASGFSFCTGKGE